MDNYKDIHIIIKAEKCPYWDFDNQKSKCTCNSCCDLPEGNDMDTIRSGVIIDGNRYCMLDCDIDGEIIRSLKSAF